MQVGTLINNVGLSYDHPDYLTTLDDTFIRQIIDINCLATTKVGCKAGHPGWSASTWSKRKVFSGLFCAAALSWRAACLACHTCAVLC